MSKLPHSSLETHEAGTLGQAAIINANWRILEAILNPDLLDTDPTYGQLYGAIARAMAGQKVPATILTSATGVTVDLREGEVQTLYAVHNVTFTLDGKKTGRRTRLFVKGSGGARTLTWPGSNFAWASAAITSVGSGKWAIIDLQSIYDSDASTDTLVIASGQVAP